MTKVEAARRLGVAEHMVLVVEAHPAGHLATLRNGAVMLVSETVARAYVPEVDDVEAKVFLGDEDVTEHVKEKPKAASKRRTSGGSGS